MGRAGPTLSVNEELHIDQVCLAFEAAWQNTPHPSIEQHLGDVAEPESSALLAELLLLDLDYRMAAGESPDRDEYCVRFPGHGRVVEAAFRQCGLPCAAAGTAHPLLR